MSGFLLVPTAMALQNSARGTGSSISPADLFLPGSDYMQVLYHPYGIGLTTFVLTVLITGFTYKKWKENYIHIACFLVIMLPVFQYVLNGGLYIRGKVLIPMLPLLCYLISMYIEKQRKGEIYFVQGILPFLVTIIVIWGGSCLLLMDAGIMLLCGLLFYRKHKEKIFLIVPIGMLLLYGTIMNGWFSERTERDFYNQVTDNDYRQITKEILKKEKGFYRMEQAGGRFRSTRNCRYIGR